MSTREEVMREWAPNERKPYWNGLGLRLDLAKHTPLQALYMRNIDVAVEEARDTRDGLPTDDAVLAVDWIFRKSEPRGPLAVFYMSMEHACHVLGIDVRRLRGNLRVYLGYQTICTAQADKARVFALTSKPLPDDTEELFEDFRCVPALDQQNLFGPGTVN